MRGGGPSRRPPRPIVLQGYPTDDLEVNNLQFCWNLLKEARRVMCSHPRHADAREILEKEGAETRRTAPSGRTGP
jgi:hypothetical protein